MQHPTPSAREIVLTASREAIDQRNASAVDLHFSSAFIEHAQSGGEGREGLKAFVAELGDDFEHRRFLTIAEGDLVVVCGQYLGYGPSPLDAFDIWRTADGTVAEHWDSVAEGEVGLSALGELQETTAPASSEAGEQNRSIVTSLTQHWLVEGDASAGQRGFATQFKDYSPAHAITVDEGGVPSTGPHAPSYDTIHQVIAEGPYVFVRSAGTDSGGAAGVAINDLWKVEDGAITSHWGIVEAIQDTHHHANGVF